jgi:hypothetical protein
VKLNALSMYVVDKENSTMDYVKQMKTAAAPELQILKVPIRKFSDLLIACEKQMKNENPNWFTINNI